MVKNYHLLDREVPSAMHDARRELVASFIIFVVSALIGVVSAAGDPDFVRLILGNSYVDMTLNNIANGESMAVYNGSSEFPCSEYHAEQYHGLLQLLCHGAADQFWHRIHAP